MTEVEALIEKRISFLKKSYEHSGEELEDLFQFWKKIHDKIYQPTSNECSEFLKLFNNIKYITFRTEFTEKYQLPYSCEIFDVIDNLLSRLTSTGKGQEYSSLFTGTVIHEMQENILTTKHKLNILIETIIKASPEIKFYITCFSFMLAMEGLYDDIVRFVYATEQIIAGNIVDHNKLKIAKINDIKSMIKNPPKEIFDIWTQGHRVRNAIAHASFYYNTRDNSMKFVDVHPSNIDDIAINTLTLMELHDLIKKIIVINAAYEDLILLLWIYTGFIIPPHKLIKS